MDTGFSLLIIVLSFIGAIVLYEVADYVFAKKKETTAEVLDKYYSPSGYRKIEQWTLILKLANGEIAAVRVNSSLWGEKSRNSTVTVEYKVGFFSGDKYFSLVDNEEAASN